MSKLEELLGRLLKVRARSKNTWTACCPAHGDKNPSLGIKLLDDGRILLHCFSGCTAEEVVAAVGLVLTDLFPEPVLNETGAKPVKPAFFASDLMRIIHFEALVVMIVALDIDKGKAPSEETRQRVRLAYERIDEAVRYANAG
tara:strand:- start:101 stop:529 length:429 start_codon:yes stop_codon:yes gene_type:complete